MEVKLKSPFLEGVQKYIIMSVLGLALPFLFGSLSSYFCEEVGICTVPSFLSDPFVYVTLIFIYIFVVIELFISRTLYSYAKKQWKSEKKEPFPKSRQRLYLFSVIVLLSALFFPLIFLSVHVLFLTISMGIAIWMHFFGFFIATIF